MPEDREASSADREAQTDPEKQEKRVESRERSDQNRSSTEGESWQEHLARVGTLTPEITERILSLHGHRGRRAIDAVGESRVKQYRDFTVVVGHTEEYVVEGGACTCKDATYNLDADEDERCWHALAVAIATRTDALDHHDMWYSEVRDFV